MVRALTDAGMQGVYTRFCLCKTLLLMAWLRFKNLLAGHGLVGLLKIPKPCSISCNHKCLRFAGSEGMERILRVCFQHARMNCCILHRPPNSLNL